MLPSFEKTRSRVQWPPPRRRPPPGRLGQIFRGAARLQIAILVGEAHDAVGVADVDVLGIGSQGIERDAEGLVQAFGEDGRLLRLAVGVDAAKDPDLAGLALGQEEVAVGRDAQQARIVETGGVELDLEALGRDGPGIGGARNHAWAVVDGLVGRGRGQVGDGEVAADAGRLVGRIGEGGLAGQNAGRWRLWRAGEGFLAAKAMPSINRQKTVQIRACVLRKRIMRPLGALRNRDVNKCLLNKMREQSGRSPENWAGNAEGRRIVSSTPNPGKRELAGGL